MDLCLEFARKQYEYHNHGLVEKQEKTLSGIDGSQ